MRYRFWMPVLMVVFVTFARAEPPATQPVPSATTARRVISVEGSSLNLDEEDSVQALRVRVLRTMQSAIQGLSRGNADQVTVKLSPTTPRHNMMLLEVTTGPRAEHAASGVATRVADATVEEIRRELQAEEFRRAGDAFSRQRRTLDERRDALQRHCDALDHAMNDFRDSLRQLGVVADGPEDVRALAGKLDEERQRMTIDRPAFAARETALEQGLQSLIADGKKAVENDEVSKELQKVVDVRSSRLDEVRKAYERGIGSATEIGDAEIQLADAKARLLERREALIRAAGGDATADLRKQLVALHVDQAESDARLAAIDRLAESLVKAERIADSLHELEIERDGVRSALNALVGAIDSLVPPRPQVTVTAVEPAAESGN